LPALREKDFAKGTVDSVPEVASLRRLEKAQHHIWPRIVTPVLCKTTHECLF